MVCKQCGNEVAPNEKFCGVCGAPTDAVADQPQYAQPAQPAQPQYGQPMQPQYNAAAPIDDPAERALSKSCLTFGILAIAFGVSFYLSFLGIVFGAITKSKTSLYMASYPLTGRAKTGRILGNIGFIFGIILTVFFVIWLIVVIAAASAGSIYYY